VSKNDRKILIFTGAGASYGCEHILPKQPPLGNQLYDELATFSPHSWGRIPSKQASQFRQNFEAGMGTILQQQSLLVPQLMRDMAIYFSRFNLDASWSDLYSQLMVHILKNNLQEQIVLSTINYECVFELAVSNLGLSIDYFSTKPSNNQKITFWKLHGSCNFKPKNIQATSGVTFTRGVAFEAGIQVIPLNQVPIFCRNTGLYPAMSIFVQGKPTPISPSSIKLLQGYWANYVDRADSIAIIGVNPNPLDKHIWDPLTNTDASIYYIGNQEAFNFWSHKYRPKKSNMWLADTFKDGFRRMLQIL